MLRQIEAETDAKRQREEQQKRVDAQAAARAPGPKATDADTSAAPAATPMKIIRLETARGPVDIGVQDDGTALLNTLQDAGYRTR